MFSISTLVMVFAVAALCGLTTHFFWLNRARQLIAESKSQYEVDAASLRERLQQRESQVVALELDRQEAKRTQMGLQSQYEELLQQKTMFETQLASLQQDMIQKTATFSALEENMRTSFQALSAQALKHNNESFMNLAETVFGKFRDGTQADLEKREMAFAQLMEPLKTSLVKVDEKVAAIEKERVGAYHGMQQQIKSMLDAQTDLRKETANLVRALRSPITRGRWGEIQLKRVVEMAGMLEHCDFYEQQSSNLEEGASDKKQRLRPDMLVRLPGQKNIVVDAKAPLQAYLDALEAPNDEVRAERLRDHAGHVKKHIQQLSQKAYWEQFNPAPEFVVLFLPGEPFFSAALEFDPGLIEFGVAQKIILATPTTLISLLRSVAYGWRGERLADNAKEVCELGKVLYRRIGDLSQHVQDLGGRLQGAVQAYNKTIGTLESRVLVSARRFKDLDLGEGIEVADLPPVEQATRQLQAPELV